MDKKRVNLYLDDKIKWYEDRLAHSKSLDDACIGKSMFIECETQILYQLNEVKSFMNSGLADMEVEDKKEVNTVRCVCTNCNSIDMKLSGDSKYLICNNCLEKVYIRDLDIGFSEVKQNDEVVENFICEECGELLPIRKVKKLNGMELCSKCYSEEKKK